MSVFGRIFGTDTIIEKAVQTIGKSILGTDEKVADLIQLNKSYEPFKLAQRVLAFALVGVYSFIWLLASVMFCISGFMDASTLVTAPSNHLAESAKVMGQLNNETLGMPVALIVTFYFGGGALEGVVRRLKEGKTQ